MNPEILLHPNIPKPLHGVNPRTIKGKDWWDVERQKVYKERNYTCWACGVHKRDAKFHSWLEAHELYEINYSKGTVKFKGLCALCHSCHNYIHNGRLEILYLKGEITFSKFSYILQSRSDILISKRLPINAFAFSVMCRNSIPLPIKYNVQTIDDSVDAEWDEGKLLFEGKEYYSNFKDISEWKSHYSKSNRKTIGT